MESWFNSMVPLLHAGDDKDAERLALAFQDYIGKKRMTILMKESERKLAQIDRGVSK